MRGGRGGVGGGVGEWGGSEGRGKRHNIILYRP